jgi:phenylpropionate dioxygenase-like ring-hydroxylating dioxygenase large terminal subunit
MMFIKNVWYVAGWASEVVTDTLIARTYLNVPVVLWRDPDEVAHAFEDRCCHRGAPLSRGRLEGDRLRCMYHGLLFDKTGRCIEVPGQDKIPLFAKVRSFPLVEKDTFLWIWMGDVDKADPALIPDLPWMQSPEWAHLEGYTHYDANYLLLCDNLLDLAHLPYVHPTTLGGDEAYAKTPATIERIENGLRVTRWVRNISPPPFLQAVKPYEGLVDRWNNYDFLLPALFLMDSGVAPAGTGAPEGHRVDSAEFRSTQAITPETENSAHYWYCQPHNFSVDDPEVTRSVMNAVEKAFLEDKAMITSQARSLDLEPDFRMIPIRADEGLTKWRRLVEQRLKEEAAEAAGGAQVESVATAI